MRFFRHDGIYRSDVSSPLFTPGRTRFPVGPVPRYRTRRKAHALPIVRDEFRPAIPRRVARQHCPPPLHRHHQIKTIAALNGILYHRTVASLLTVRLSAGDKPKVCLEGRCSIRLSYAPKSVPLLILSYFSLSARLCSCTLRLNCIGSHAASPFNAVFAGQSNTEVSSESSSNFRAGERVRIG